MGVAGAATAGPGTCPSMGLSSSDIRVASADSSPDGEHGEYSSGGDGGSPTGCCDGGGSEPRGVAGVAWIAMYWFVSTTSNEQVQLHMCMYENRRGHAMHLTNYSICT